MRANGHPVCFLNAIPERGGVIFVPNDFRALVCHLLTRARGKEKERRLLGRKETVTMRSDGSLHANA